MTEEIKTKILALTKDKCSASVRFVLGEVVHVRRVNCVFDETGNYDKAKTQARIDAVAVGVANKIALGVIK